MVRKRFEDNDYTLLTDEYINAKTPLPYICKKHADKGIQYITYGNIQSGKGCVYCGYERSSDKRRLSLDDVSRIFSAHDMELVPGQSYTTTADHMKYICKNHVELGVQTMSVRNAYSNRCPYCNSSKGEAKIQEYLLRNGIEFETQKKYDDLIGLGGRKLSYDFFIPKINMLIEYQGQFHDGTAKIQTDIDYSVQIEHDTRKREYAEKRGIRLVEIWYHDDIDIATRLDQVIKS